MKITGTKTERVSVKIEPLEVVESLLDEFTRRRNGDSVRMLDGCLWAGLSEQHSHDVFRPERKLTEEETSAFEALTTLFKFYKKPENR